MKTTTTIAFLTFLLLACENSSSVNSFSNGTSKAGEVSLAFEKATIPSEVSSITVVLSRQGFDSLKKQLVVQNDSTAQISFNNIQIGVWLVTINAYGSDALIKYTGSSQVQVNEGAVTNLSIVLQPVTLGVGSVNIVVRWGGEQSMNWKNWIHSSANPILKKGTTTIDKYGVGQPFLFSDNGVWKMTVLNVGEDSLTKRLVGSIGLATTTDDGTTWKKNVKPLLTVGKNSWNNYSIAPGPMYKVGTEYKMLYTGADSSQRYMIGTASSMNGIDWESASSPAFQSLGDWDKNMVAGDVLFVDGKYYFFISCRSNDIYAFTIGLATSVDGKNWIRYGTKPIMTVSQTWEGQGVYFPSVIYENGKFTMMYSSTTNSVSPAFGIATSSDGMVWKKLENNPVIIKGPSHSTWAPNEISYPSFKKINGVYRAYYTGFNWTSVDPEWSIGYASLQ